MTLGDDIRAALPRLRAEAESRMDSTCRVESLTGVPDPLTGRPDPEVVHESLPCRVKATGKGGLTAATAAGVQEVTRQLHVPHATTGLREGLRVTITASEQASLVGRELRLVGWGDGDQMTAQRWEVEEWTI